MTEASLVIETELPFSWTAGELSATLHQSNRLLMRVANLLDSHDPEQSAASERLEAKLDLMLNWLGHRLFGEAGDQPVTRLWLASDWVEWEQSSTTGLSETGVLNLAISPTLPGPLRMAARLLQVAQGRVRAQPIFPDKEQEEAWNQWLFRLHRRAIQEARLKSDPA